MVPGKAGLTVAFQGARGSFSDEAIERIWKGEATPVPTRDFAGAVQAVVRGDTDYAVLPIENTAIGSIVESRAAIAAATHNTKVVGEMSLEIRHCLLAPRAASLASVRRVFSHPAALAQCSRFFASHSAMLAVAAYDTAGSAADVANRGDTSEAAIAPFGAAALYGLHVLASNIQDDPDNATRFVILGSSAIIGNDGRKDD